MGEAADSNSSPATVLVVDDEPTLLELMARVLRRAGHRVLPAGDAGAAVEAFEKSERPVAAVLIDLRMRPRGGTVILDELLARSPDLGVVITSGSALDAETRQSLRARGGEFVRKPFAPEELLRAVSVVLERAAGSPIA